MSMRVSMGYLYLCLLPIPPVTFEGYSKFMETGSEYKNISMALAPFTHTSGQV